MKYFIFLRSKLKKAAVNLKYQFSNRIQFPSHEILNILLKFSGNFVPPIFAIMNDIVPILDNFLKVLLCFLAVLTHFVRFSKNHFLT